MSTATDTTPAAEVKAEEVEGVKAEVVAETAATTLPSEDSDSKIKLADIPERVKAILTAASSMPADKRADLDTRAVKLAFRDLRAVKKDAPVIHKETELPKYGDSGVGSLRYTHERASMLAGLAQANGARAQLTYTSYSYPNPNSKRRLWRVQVWGTQEDIARTVAMFEAFQLRGVADSTNPSILNVAGQSPADMKKTRRAWWRNFANSVPAMVEEVLGDLMDDKVDTAVSDRLTAAEKAEAEWLVANEQLPEAQRQKLPKAE